MAEKTPKGWKRQKLIEVMEFTSGKAHEPFVCDTGPYVVGNSKFVSSQGKTRKYCSESRLTAESDDILMVMSDVPNGKALAKAYYVKEANKVAVNQRICNLRTKHGDARFYFYQLDRNRYFLKFNDGINQTNLSNSIFKNCSILVPPLSEQRRIAEILRTWDEAIEKLETLRLSILDRRSWIRSNILSGEIRLGNFNTPWEEVAFSEVLHEHGQNSQPQDEVFSVSVHKGLINQIEHLGRSFSAANTDHYNRVLPGDIVYTKSPTGDFPLGIIKQSTVDDPVIVSPLYGVFTPESRALGTILDAFFESPVTTQNYLHPLVQKGAKNTIAITNTRFLEGRLKLPRDPIEQEAIAEFIETDRSQVKGIEAEIDALQRQKRGLMQKLLTGEWRVNASLANNTISERR